MCNRTLFCCVQKILLLLLFLTDENEHPKKNHMYSVYNIVIVSFLSMTLTKTIHLRQNNIKMYYKIPQADTTAQSPHNSQNNNIMRKKTVQKMVVICSFHMNQYV